MSEHEPPEDAGPAEPERYQRLGQAGFGSEGAAGGSAEVPAPGEHPIADEGDDAVAPADGGAAQGALSHERAPNMLPGRARRGTGLERFMVRLVATGGVIGIGVGIAAILAANHVQGWIIGLAVSAVSVLLSAILWSSRQV
ncbi:MAG: hypothetical protein ACR2GZ_10970 [Solirubrobacteraceae bacterium]